MRSVRALLALVLTSLQGCEVTAAPFVIGGYIGSVPYGGAFGDYGGYGPAPLGGYGYGYGTGYGYDRYGYGGYGGYGYGSGHYHPVTVSHHQPAVLHCDPFHIDCHIHS